MPKAHRRHDISDRTWSLLEPHLPGRKGSWGGLAKDNRLFINAVFWIMRTGPPWRDLPLILATGAIRTAVSSVGAIRAYGRSC